MDAPMGILALEGIAIAVFILLLIIGVIPSVG